MENIGKVNSIFYSSYFLLEMFIQLGGREVRIIFSIIHQLRINGTLAPIQPQNCFVDILMMNLIYFAETRGGHSQLTIPSF